MCDVMERAAARVERRLSVMFAEVARFEWLLSQLKDAPTRYSVAQLEAQLVAPATLPGQHERLLVMLAVRRDPRAQRVLRAWTPPQGDPRLAAFHQLAMMWHELALLPAGASLDARC